MTAKDPQRLRSKEAIARVMQRKLFVEPILRDENTELKIKIAKLERENAELKDQVAGRNVEKSKTG